MGFLLGGANGFLAGGAEAPLLREVFCGVGGHWTLTREGAAGPVGLGAREGLAAGGAGRTAEGGEESYYIWRDCTMNHVCEPYTPNK